MTPPRLALARRKARDLLANNHVKAPSVPVVEFARKLGAIIRYEPVAGEQLEGVLYQPLNGSPIIGVNSLDSGPRQRFTIAHELGHLLLHPREEIHVDANFVLAFRNQKSSTASDVREIEANQFAAELLVPLAFLEHDLRQMKIDLESSEDIAGLADRYGVSKQAMTIRLSTLARLS